LLLTVGLIGAALGAALGFIKPLEIAGLPKGVVALLLAIGAFALPLFGLSWPLYRLMHLRPLCLPICPHCGKPTRFCMSRKKPVDSEDGIPGLYVYWPEFVGLWRPVEDLTEKRFIRLKNAPGFARGFFKA